jgi:hypothetical protein
MREKRDTRRRSDTSASVRHSLALPLLILQRTASYPNPQLNNTPMIVLTFTLTGLAIFTLFIAAEEV